MAIKGGQIIHAGNGVTVIDRIQTGGPGQLNIPTERINELGNYKSVATVRDVPDLTFSLESFDVSTEIEAMIAGQYGGRSLTGVDITAASSTLTAANGAFTSADVGKGIVVYEAGTGGAELDTTVSAVTNATTVTLTDAAATTVTGGTATLYNAAGIDLARAKAIDIASQFKAGQQAPEPFQVISSIAAPHLTVEQMSYRFGLRDNASQTAQLRGDMIFYNPGSCYVESVAGTNAANQTVVTAHPAQAVAEGDARRVLSVTAGGKRLTFGVDYTETYGAVTNGAAVTTVRLDDPVPTTDTVRIVYSSPDVLEYPQTVHPSVVLKPAAVKGRDIDVYVGGYDPDNPASSAANKLTSVQAATLEWRVTLEKDEEFGNDYAIAQDYTDSPQVNGTIDIKPRDPAEFLALLRKTQGVTDAQAVLGTKSTVPLPLDIVIRHPDTDRVVKRLHVDDARFTPPGFQGRVAQKSTISLPYESDEGELLVFGR